jgi:hypothetical protein
MSEYIYEPGIDLDTIVATEVLGLTIEWDLIDEDWKIFSKTTKQLHPLPKFSEDTNAAYIVINHMQTRGFFNQLGSSSGGPSIVWRSSFHRKGNNTTIYSSSGRTLGHATCLAALNVVRGIKQKTEIKTEIKTDISNSVVSFPIPVKDNIIKFPFKKD